LKQEILNYICLERKQKIITTANIYADALNHSRTDTKEKPNLASREHEIAKMGDWIDYLTDDEVKPIQSKFYAK